ncbi:MAG: LutC/YkgG family protein [Flavipsychrobacter sp.]
MQTLKTSKAKENILSRIRKSLADKPVAMPFPEAEKENANGLFTKSDMSAEEGFANAFIALGGKFVFCDNEKELLENIYNLYESRGWKQLLCSDSRLLQLFENNKLNIANSADTAVENADACITDCETLVARTGSIVFSSRQHMGRTAPVFYPVHLVVAYANQAVPDIEQAITLLKKKYGDQMPSMINLNTGPSRTADIEKTLVVGVHGPGEVFCFYVNA